MRARRQGMGRALLIALGPLLLGLLLSAWLLLARPAPPPEGVTLAKGEVVSEQDFEDTPRRPARGREHR